MGAWKIGYPSGITTASSEANGMLLYAPWTISPITLISKTPKRLGLLSTSYSSNTLSNSSAGMTTNEYQYGWCKIRSGALIGCVYKVASNTSTTLTLVDFNTSKDDPAFTENVYFEVFTGPSTYTFPSARNPSKADIKIGKAVDMDRLPFYQGGYRIPLNYEEDMVINAWVTSDTELENLLMVVKAESDYMGGDSMYTNELAAPLVLETGTHDADHQYLVHCTEAKKIRDGARGNLVEVELYFEQIAMPSYRSI